jgi:hypothetical protein
LFLAPTTLDHVERRVGADLLSRRLWNLGHPFAAQRGDGDVVVDRNRRLHICVMTEFVASGIEARRG